MPVAVTLAYLYWMQHDVNWVNGVWALLNIVVFHAAGNTWSDYFDYKHRVDREDTHGVKTLTGGMFQPQEIFRLSLSLLAVALAAGILLLLRTGLPLFFQHNPRMGLPPRRHLQSFRRKTKRQHADDSEKSFLHLFFFPFLRPLPLFPVRKTNSFSECFYEKASD